MGLIAEERSSFVAIVGDAGTNSQDPKFSPEDGLTQVIQAESLDKRELNVFQLGCNTAPGLNNPHEEINGAPARKGKACLFRFLWKEISPLRNTGNYKLQMTTENIQKGCSLMCMRH